MKVLWIIFWLATVAIANKTRDPSCYQKPGVNGAGFGVCQVMNRMYSYYPNKGECLEFIYNGCGGNNNRFFFKEVCEDKCKVDTNAAA